MNSSSRKGALKNKFAELTVIFGCYDWVKRQK